MPRILIVDDEKSLRGTLRLILEDESFDVSEAETADKALNIIEKGSDIDVVVTDARMPGMDGYTLLEKIKQNNPEMPVLMITAYATPKMAVKAIQSGANDYIPKPFDPEEIIFSVRNALDYARLKNENVQLKETIEKKYNIKTIIGSNEKIIKICKLIRDIAPTNSTVLIEGESGTGKELVAHAIHQESNRKDMRFIAVNSAALPEALLESELFGHEKGAFTGAHMQRKGKFELAEGGTIYLDEIADMSEMMQAKILRVLEEKTFERVGGSKTLITDTRVVAATNKDLKVAMKAGEFRKDLYYRLNVIHIVLPPLRERIDDIPVIAESFIKEYNTQFSKKVSSISERAMELLLRYSWPGNVRELRNLIERAILLSKDEELTEKDFTDEILTESPSADVTEIDVSSGISFKEAVNNLEKRLVLSAMDKSENRPGKAAKKLGLSRHALRYYLQKYKLYSEGC
ncbi:MAG: sigma-54 dependent transcriptional regulator [Candidatus Theseobacter exili]|nr:sigma-54 dependent transcriptional regulator [Candidatus Theseobacter exili]